MSKKILVVEDEPDVLKVIDFILNKKGYQVITAIDGKQALDLAKEHHPDLIILDFFLPVMTGKEVGEQLNIDEDLKNIPILLLTASADDIAKKAKECKVNDYLLKPFEYTELLERIDALLK
jgi:two-component system, OmpR family, alkaline phosphatase synthesis response regulator PhoP